jgi:AcrR family transcriptional regulator
LFAVHGITAVSARMIAEEAGAANNSAVGYHFGGKLDLVRAIERQRKAAIEEVCARMLAQTQGSRDPRDHIACLVVPIARHLAALGPPTWYARFLLQAVTAPETRPIIEESRRAPHEREAVRRLMGCVPVPDPETLRMRSRLLTGLLSNAFAEHEAGVRAKDTEVRDWAEVGRFLCDAVHGMLLGPVEAEGAATRARGDLTRGV